MSLIAPETLTERIRHLETVELLEIGAGPPVHFAAEGTMYWDRIDDDFYVNDDGANGWQLVGGGGGVVWPHNLLSGTHTDTVAATPQRGDLVVAQEDDEGTVDWERLGIGAAGEYLYSDGTDAKWWPVFQDGTCTPTTIEPDDTAAVGISEFVSRCDHRHEIVCAVAVNIANANAEGAATDFARSDHVHNHPAGLGVNLHHDEIHVVDSTGPHTEAGLTIGHVLRASGAAAFSFAAIQAGDLPGLGAVPALTFGLVNAAGAAATYVQTDASLAIFDAVVPGTIQCDDAAATGAAAFSARRDHQHAIVCAAPAANLSVSTTNAEGAATSFARSDHSHAITSSSNPGAAASILATDASGYLQLVGLGIGTAATAANSVTFADDGWEGLGPAAGRIIYDDQAVDEICFEDCFVGINDLTPTTWLEITDYVTAYPCLCLGAAGNGEIATPDTEALRFGHWNAGATTFTSRFHMTPSALVFADGFDIHLPILSFIGTDAAGARLRFNSAGATNYAYFALCNVGINTGTPGYELDIIDAADHTIQAIRTYSVTDGHTPALFFMKSHQDTVGLTATGDGDYLGNIRFYGVDNTGPDWALGVNIYAIQRGAAGAAQVGTDLVFETYSTTAANSNQLYLDGGTGFVGIGTAPEGRLHGYGTIGGFLYWEYDGVGAAAQTIIPNGAGDVSYILGGYYVMRASDTTTRAAPLPGTLTPGNSADIDPGAGVLTLAVAADGSVTIQRTGGALTYKVAFWLLWI